MRGVTDGELLGALWRTHFRRTGERDRAGALRSMLRETRDLARAHDGGVKANIILASAGEVLAVRYAEGMEPNSLYSLAGDEKELESTGPRRWLPRHAGAESDGAASTHVEDVDELVTRGARDEVVH